MFYLTDTGRRYSQRSTPDDARTSDYNAQVHQELVYVIHYFGNTTLRRCHRSADRSVGRNHEEKPSPFPRDIQPGAQHLIQSLPPEQGPTGVCSRQWYRAIAAQDHEDRQATEGVCPSNSLRHGPFWEQRPPVPLAKQRFGFLCVSFGRSVLASHGLGCYFRMVC